MLGWISILVLHILFKCSAFCKLSLINLHNYRLVDVKTEESNDMSESSNPELHFTSFDGDSSSALESGLQLLNTLEAEEK